MKNLLFDYFLLSFTTYCYQLSYYESAPNFESFCFCYSEMQLHLWLIEGFRRPNLHFELLLLFHCSLHIYSRSQPFYMTNTSLSKIDSSFHLDIPHNALPADLVPSSLLFYRLLLISGPLCHAFYHLSIHQQKHHHSNTDRIPPCRFFHSWATPQYTLCNGLPYQSYLWRYISQYLLVAFP